MQKEKNAVIIFLKPNYSIHSSYCKHADINSFNESVILSKKNFMLFFTFSLMLSYYGYKYYELQLSVKLEKKFIKFININIYK